MVKFLVLGTVICSNWNPIIEKAKWTWNCRGPFPKREGSQTLALRGEPERTLSTRTWHDSTAPISELSHLLEGKIILGFRIFKKWSVWKVTPWITRCWRNVYFRLLSTPCAQSCWLFVMPWATARHVSLSMEFTRQEYWSGLPFPPPYDKLLHEQPNIEEKHISGLRVIFFFFFCG